MIDYFIKHQENLMLSLQAICGFVAFLTLITGSLSKKRKLAIFLLEISAAFILGSARTFVIYNGSLVKNVWLYVRLSKFFDYFFSLFIVFSLNLYLKDLFVNEGGLEKYPRRLLFADFFVALGILFLVVSQFTGLYYTFDANNIYHRSSGRFIANVFPLLALGLQFSCMVRYHNKFSSEYKEFARGIKIPIMLFTILPIATTIVQQKIQGLHLASISTVGMSVFIYVFAIYEMNKEIERAHKMEVEILERYQKELEETVQKRTYELRLANEKAERLLLNILPKDIAQELTENPDKTISKKYPNATVLFTDIVGFTKMSGEMTAEETVSMLNKMTSLFDERSQKEGIEKIKTIGDAYMAVSGLTETSDNDGAQKMIRFAQGLLEDVEKFNSTYPTKIQIRIGINSGNLVAGVIGKIKFIYDVWGDTVNVASRMEGSGEPMRVHVSQSVFEQTQNDFSWQGPIQVEVKGKGKMNGYFLN